MFLGRRPNTWNCFDCLLWNFKPVTTVGPPLNVFVVWKKLLQPKLSSMFLSLLQLQTFYFLAEGLNSKAYHSDCCFLKTYVLYSRDIICPTISVFVRLQSPVNSSTSVIRDFLSIFKVTDELDIVLVFNSDNVRAMFGWFWSQ